MSLQNLLTNIAVKQLAVRPFWTINMSNKAPMDFNYFRYTGKIAGAIDSKALTDLYTLMDFFKTEHNSVPQQFVYSLDCKRDGICILDIESKCPEDIKQKLLSELPYVYGDISMSGHGAHLMFPCPELDEITSSKIVMKEEHGWYEILLAHYVTFTDNTLPERDYKDQTKFLELWNTLKATQKLASKEGFDISKNRPEYNFSNYNALVANTKSRFKAKFTKRPIDYNNDMSKYEFAVVGSLKIALLTMLDFPIYHNLNLDLNQKVWIVFELAQEILEPRPKHDEFRDNMPWLLYITYNSFVTSYEKK